jgi:hypothetical protein
MVARTKARGVIFASGVLGAIVCMGAGSGVALAQTTSSPATDTHTTFSAAGPRVVTGAPYSSSVEERHTQSLANGTNIDMVTGVTKQYRDAQGRARQEHYSVKDGITSEKPNLIVIYDPVGGVRYDLNPHTKTARSFPLGVGAAQGVVSSNEAGTPPAARTPTTTETARQEISHSSLGTDSMLGEEVTGSRVTSVYPAGTRGNDQPLTIVIDSWVAPDLRVVMLRKQDDPRTGVVEWRVTQIDLTEPDASLFQVPQDYTIVER